MGRPCPAGNAISARVVTLQRRRNGLRTATDNLQVTRRLVSPGNTRWDKTIRHGGQLVCLYKTCQVIALYHCLHLTGRTMSQTILILGSAIAGLLYLAWLVLYRLYFSPVAHIPGPLLAKLSFWYEFYHDVVLTGQYTFKIRQLHQHYGPIIRINPQEVHIADPDFYDIVHTGASHKRDKWAWFCNQFGIPDSAFATVKHDVHRMRRAALNPFFSKAKVRSLQPLIQDVAHQLLTRLDEFKHNGEHLTLSLAYAALTNGISSHNHLFCSH